MQLDLVLYVVELQQLKINEVGIYFSWACYCQKQQVTKYSYLNIFSGLIVIIVVINKRYKKTRKASTGSQKMNEEVVVV